MLALIEQALWRAPTIMPNENPDILAEKIARLLQMETHSSDFSSLRGSLEKINQRLDKIEFQMSPQNPQFATRVSHSNHPSQHKFEIAEAVAQEATESFETEKACPYEPTGKPCDHCGMCNSRGF